MANILRHVSTGSNVTAMPGDHVVATGTTLTVTLPSPIGEPVGQAKPSEGWEVFIHNTASGNVTVNTSDGSLIDGSATATLATGLLAEFTANRGQWYRTV